jgi:hypothetical protein
LTLLPVVVFGGSCGVSLSSFSVLSSIIIFTVFCGRSCL